MDEQRALLDRLMGKDRNLTADKRKHRRRKRWDDEDVCQYYVCGFCPHDLFFNTKFDLGPCPYDHEDPLREQFQRSSSKRKQRRTEQRFLRFLYTLVDDCDQMIVRAKKRLQMQDENLDSKQSERDAAIDEIENEIEETTEKMEKLGEEGKVDEAKTLLTKLQQLQVHKKTLEDFSAIDRFEICDVCGAREAPKLVNNQLVRGRQHIDGKQHRGFEQIRNYIAELEKKFAERDSRSRSRSRSRSHKRSRRRDRSRDRSKDRSRDRRRKSEDSDDDDDDKDSKNTSNGVEVN